MTGTARTLYKDWLWSVIYQLPQETVDLAACTVNKKRVLHNGGENNYLMCSVFDWDCQALPASLNYGMYDDWMVHSVSTCVPLWSFPSFLNLLLIQFWIRRYDPGVRDTTQGCEQTIHLRHLRIINDIKVNVDDLGDTLGIWGSPNQDLWWNDAPKGWFRIFRLEYSWMLWSHSDNSLCNFLLHSSVTQLTHTTWFSRV